MSPKARNPERCCSSHDYPPVPMDYCLVCGGPTSPLRGVILERLYPKATSCDGCGRRQAHCTCERAA